MPLPVLIAGAARMAASGAAKKAASGAAKKAASGAAKKTVATNVAGGTAASPVNSPALTANAKTIGNYGIPPEPQQELALRTSRSEKTNKEALENTGGATPDAEQTSDPIRDRIRQQLEIRKAQQEDEENEESSDEESQEEKLNRSQESARSSIASMASQMGGQLAGTLAKTAKAWSIFTSIVGGIISFLGGIITIFGPILLPILIIVFCFALVYNYISEHQISGGYQIMTSQFEKLLTGAANNTPPSSPASTTQNKK